MPVIIPPGFSYFELIINLIGDSEDMLLTTGVQHAAGVNPTVSGYTALANLIAGQLDDRISSSYSFTGWRARQGQDGDPLVFEGTLSPAVVGDRTSPVNPSNTAVLVRKVTGVGGRRNTGRWFIPGVINADQTDAGVMTTAAAAAWQSALDLIVAGVPALSPDQFENLVILHSDSTPPTDVTNLNVQLRLATQRRRLRP